MVSKQAKKEGVGVSMPRGDEVHMDIRDKRERYSLVPVPADSISQGLRYVVCLETELSLSLRLLFSSEITVS